MILFNGKEVKFTKFPNNETKVDENSILCTQTDDIGVITFKFQDDSDLIKLMLVRKYLNDILPSIRVALFITYMPYSRMDRTEDLSVFTLKYISEFINSLNFEVVMICEPHSDVTPALINHCHVVPVTKDLLPKVIEEVNFDKENDYLFFPDAGAQKRYAKLAPDCKNLVGYKQRDWSTGKIESLQLVGELPNKPFKAIIVDDLCSYGGTFMASAKELEAVGAYEIYLLVAHCENSIFKGQIPGSKLIDKVFTTNSILDEYSAELTDGKIKVYNIKEVK